MVIRQELVGERVYYKREDNKTVRGSITMVGQGSHLLLLCQLCLTRASW